MRVSSKVTLKTSMVVAGSLLAFAHPASAQSYGTSAQKPVVAVRIGGYFTSNSTVSHSVGSSFLCGGLDYDVKDQVNVSRTIVSVDYIARSSGSNDFRMFPVTVGEMVLGSTNNGVQPYYGLGLGGYFIHQKLNTNAQDYVAFGGYAAVGIQYNRYFLLDARYNLVTPSHGVNADGLELTAGFRF